MKTELEDYDEINHTGANILGEMFRSKLSWTLLLSSYFLSLIQKLIHFLFGTMDTATTFTHHPLNQEFWTLNPPIADVFCAAIVDLG
jgi:hypothetical protein